jgi:predicted dinucleotide-binding enzyme
MALAQAFISKGESILFGVREPANYLEAVYPLGSKASIAPTAAALKASGKVVILATPYEAALTIAASLPDWENRILVDATNPLAPGLAGLSIGTSTSAAEEIAKLAHGARVVKAFNTTGAENLADSGYPDGKVFMPVCGDDADAKAQVIALAELIGFDAVDFGDLTAARYLEPVAMAWIHMAFKLGQGRGFAFARLQR